MIVKAKIDTKDPMVMVELLTVEGWIKWCKGEELNPEDYNEDVEVNNGVQKALQDLSDRI